MFLLFRVNRDPPVSGWLVPFGCNIAHATKKQLGKWYTRTKRALPEGINPLIALGVGQKVLALGLAGTGLSFDDKRLEWLALLVGGVGVAESAGGGAFIYNLLEEEKSKKPTGKTEEKKQDNSNGQLAPQQPQQVPQGQLPPTIIIQNQPPQIIHHHHYHGSGSTLSKVSWTSSNDSIEARIPEIQTILTVCQQRLLMGKQLSQEELEALVGLTDIGTNLMSIEDLKRCLQEKNRLMRLWALTCLSNKSEVANVDQLILEMGSNIQTDYIWEPAIELLLQQDWFVQKISESTGDSKKIKTRIKDLIEKFKTK